MVKSQTTRNEPGSLRVKKAGKPLAADFPQLLTKKRLPISLKFRLRAGQTTGEKPRQLYIRLTVNGVTVSDYSSKVEVRPALWDSANQKVTGYSKFAQLTNDQLTGIVAEHKELLAELTRLYNVDVLPAPPTAEDVRHFWGSGAELVPSILTSYNTYLAYMESLAGTAEQRDVSTLRKWKNGAQYLEQYLTETKQLKRSADLANVVWADGFYRWLIKRPLGKASAARFVGHVRAALNHMVRSQKIKTNYLFDHYPDKGRDKEVYFLEEEHIERLKELKATGMLALVRDYLLLMCHTGMDYPDLLPYAANPEAFTEETAQGPIINMGRHKTRKSDRKATIPLLPEVSQILERYPDGLPVLTSATINRWCDVIEELIGFDKPLTIKICRKTAGVLFLRAGFEIAEVSAILGHASMRTTMRYYVKATGSLVQGGMRRIASREEPQAFTITKPSPFSRVG